MPAADAVPAETLPATAVPGGTGQLTASYGGDASYAAADVTVTVTVAREKTSTNLALSKTTIAYGHQTAE
jgi:hypothetical protein